MIFPKQGDKVRIVLSSGIVKEGVIEFWAEDDEKGLTWTSLKSLNSEESFMIQNYWVAGFLIIKENKDREAHKVETPQTLPEIKMDDLPNEDELKLKNLAELKKMKVESEKQSIRKFLKRPNTQIQETQYGTINFTKYTKK